MLENNVWIFTDKGANVAAKTTPFFFVVSVFVFPELIVACATVDDCFNTHATKNFCFVCRTNNTNRNATAIKNILRCVSTNATSCSPDQHHITLFHVCAVWRHEHAIASAVAQRIDRCFFPRQMLGLWHELVSFHHTQIGETAKICFVSPNSLVATKHRVVVRCRVLIINVIAMHSDSVTWFPVANRRTNSQHHTRSVTTHDVIRKIVALCPFALARKTSERTKSRDRLKDARPHRIEIDTAGHDGDKRFVGCDLRNRYFLDMHALARIFVSRSNTSKHLLFVLAHHRCAIRLGNL